MVFLRPTVLRDAAARRARSRASATTTSSASRARRKPPLSPPLPDMEAPDACRREPASRAEPALADQRRSPVRLVPYAFARPTASSSPLGGEAGRSRGARATRGRRRSPSCGASLGVPLRARRVERRGVRRAHCRGLQRRGRRRGAPRRRSRAGRRPVAPAAGDPAGRGPARQPGRRAGHPPDQRAAHAGAARRRLRHPHRALRDALGGAPAHRRHAARPGRAARARCTRAIVSRIKIMAQLDIAEKRLPQDGRIALRVAGKPVDVRVSTIPTGARRARGAAPARQAGRAPRPRAARHGRRDARAHGPADPASRTASCWSPGRPARARPPRCTRRSRGSTPRRSTS